MFQECFKKLAWSVQEKLDTMEIEEDALILAGMFCAATDINNELALRENEGELFKLTFAYNLVHLRRFDFRNQDATRKARTSLYARSYDAFGKVAQSTKDVKRTDEVRMAAMNISTIYYAARYSKEFKEVSMDDKVLMISTAIVEEYHELEEKYW